MTDEIKHYWVCDFLSVKGKTELLPLEWINEIKLPNPSELGQDSLANPMTIEEMADNIREVGWLHPTVIEIDRYLKRARFVAGNHRIQAASLLGMTHVPVYAVIVDEFDFDFEDFNGVDMTDNLTGVEERTSGFCIESPSKVFKDLMAMKYRNELPHWC